MDTIPGGPLMKARALTEFISEMTNQPNVSVVDLNLEEHITKAQTMSEILTETLEVSYSNFVYFFPKSW